MSVAAEIVFDRVTKRYEGRTGDAVHELSFTIPAGSFCVLVGPSGGGKSTTLKMVNRLVPFDSGDIRIDGRSVRDIPATELRRGIGYVIQQVGLFPHMTVEGNVATVPRLLGWDKQRIRRLTIFIAVVLPPPEGPTSTQRSPAGIVSERSSTAGRS